MMIKEVTVIPKLAQKEAALIDDIEHSGLKLKDLFGDELFALLRLARKGVILPSIQAANESCQSDKQRRKRYVKAIYAQLYLFFLPEIRFAVTLFLSVVSCALSLYSFFR